MFNIAALCVAIFAVLAFVAALIYVIPAGVTDKEARYGNSMVSVASTSADRSAALSSNLAAAIEQQHKLSGYHCGVL
jgi:uncharacterized ion transporter superfamily protein YfcC